MTFAAENELGTHLTNIGEPRDLAAIWVAVFQECQRYEYRCGQASWLTS